MAGVLEASERLLARAGGPARDSLPRIVGLMTSHVTRVAECQSLAAEGVSPREAAERLKKNRFYVEKLFEQAANFTPDELRDAIVRLAELDLALKGGSRLDFSVSVLQPARPAEMVGVRWAAASAPGIGIVPPREPSSDRAFFKVVVVSISCETSVNN